MEALQARYRLDKLLDPLDLHRHPAKGFAD
jgi:hypothetical protein